MKPLSYRDTLKKVHKAGFSFRRSAGSHEIWWKVKTSKTCVIPRHIEVRPGTLKNIVRQMGLSEKQFKDL